MKKALTAAVAAAMGLGAVPLQAAEWGYGFGYLLESSSNINRSASNPQSDWFQALLAGAAFSEATPDLTARVVAQTELRDYRKEVFEDENVLALDASALWNVSPRQLTWLVEDVYRELLRNAVAVDTPDNRVGTNMFNTGPDYFIHLGSVNTISLGARYANLYFADDLGDNERVTGTVRWLYQATSVTTYSLNYETWKVDYKEEVLNVNYQHTQSFLRIESRPSRTRFVLDLGASEIDRDRGPSVEGSLMRLTWTRELTSESNFGLSLASEYTDAGTVLLSGLSGGGATPPTDTTYVYEIATADILYSKRGELHYTRAGSDVGMSIRAYYRDLDYQLTPQDRIEQGGTLDFSYHFTATFTASLFGESRWTEFNNFVRDDNEYGYGLVLRYRVGRYTTAGFEARRTEMDSTDDAFDFVDKRYTASVIFSTTPMYAPARR